jgi:hypothetical protein
MTLGSIPKAPACTIAELALFGSPDFTVIRQSYVMLLMGFSR